MFYIFYIVYKITNMVNGKIYIGVHKTNNLNDDYMGSGKLLKRAQKKYGIENFTREYLHVFDNAEDMFNMESELVNEEFIARKDTYNIKLGGFGGWDHVNSDEESMKSKGRLALALCKRAMLIKYGVDNPSQIPENRIRISERMKYAHSQNKALSFTGLEFLGKKHSAETKAKISEKAKMKTGDKNSQFGTMWITNPESGESKKIAKDTIIPDGWVKGRKCKDIVVMTIFNPSAYNV